MSLKLQVKLMETSLQYIIIFKSFVLSLLLWSLKIYVQVSGDFWDNSYWTHCNFGGGAEANEFSLLMKWVNIFAVSSLNNAKPKNNKKELSQRQILFLETICQSKDFIDTQWPVISVSLQAQAE